MKESPGSVLTLGAEGASKQQCSDVYVHREPLSMKKLILLLAGISTAAGLILVSRSRSAPRSVDDLARNLQEAWADHHTVV